MKKNSVEDIYIGDHDEKEPKSKKGLVILLIFFAIILIGCVAGYIYITKFGLNSKKQVFVKSIVNTNMEKILNVDEYTNLFDKLMNEDAKIDSKLTFSTNDENINQDGLDFSKLEFNSISEQDLENEKMYAEFGIKYLDNDMFKAKMISDKNAIALASDEIVNKYVGIHYDKIEEILGIEFDKEKYDTILEKSEKINFSNEEKTGYAKKYINLFFENVSEENFETNENILLEKNGENINVVSYTLKLNKDELKNNLKNVLTNLKNDDELLNKIIKENSSKKSNVPVITAGNTINTQDLTNSSENVLMEEGENNNFNSSLEINQEEESDGNINDIQLLDSVGMDETRDIDEMDISDDEISLYSENEDASETDFSLILFALMTGNKVEVSKEQVQKAIDKFIEQIDKMQCDGIEITVYVSNVATEKISVKIPEEVTIDLEFFSKDENNNTIQITILNPENDEKVYEDTTYSANDGIEDISKNSSSVDGLKIILNKLSNDNNSTYNITLSLIENKKINNEIKIISKLNNNKSSSIINDISVVVKTDKSEYTVNLNNKIAFTGLENIDDLTGDNCLFLDELSEEERKETLSAIIEQIGKVYKEKIENLSFYDTNSSSSVMIKKAEEVSKKVSKDEAKQMLFDKVSEMMSEAQSNNEEFTIKNLEDLKIDGLNISTTLSEEEIIILVDTYTFKITSGFELLEVE